MRLIARIPPRGLGRRLSGVGAIVRLLAFAHRARWSDRRIGVSLMYHRLGPAQGHRSVDLVPSLAVATFARHMTIVRLGFAPVPASELLPAVRQRRRGQRLPLAVTFDDDLASHADTAAPVLSRRRIPATFFLCGVDGRRFWWELLQATVDHGLAQPALADPVVPESVRSAWDGAPTDIHRVAAALAELEPDARDAVAAHLERVLAEAGVTLDPALSTEQRRDLCAAGFEIGFHTSRHDSLPALDAAALRRALRDGREALCALTTQPVATLAYPHGACSEAVARAAAAAGFSAAFTTEPKAIGSDDDPMRLGRVECLGPVGDLARLLSAELRAEAGATRRRRQLARARRSAA